MRRFFEPAYYFHNKNQIYLIIFNFTQKNQQVIICIVSYFIDIFIENIKDPLPFLSILKFTKQIHKFTQFFIQKNFYCVFPVLFVKIAQDLYATLVFFCHLKLILEHTWEQKSNKISKRFIYEASKFLLISCFNALIVKSI